jgi:Na+-translocating ferredoxin:NAD+ oxidoreductase RnfC subunit
MECGCCTYICPAGQPLAVTNRLAKAALREYLKNENKDGGNK